VAVLDRSIMQRGRITRGRTGHPFGGGGSASDPADWQRHIPDKRRREALANRVRDPNDAFKLVLVRDMWASFARDPAVSSSTTWVSPTS
jgi:hypothetical protein